MQDANARPRRWLCWKGQVERQRMAVLRQQDGDSKNLQDILSVNSISCLLLLYKAVEGLLLAFVLVFYRAHALGVEGKLSSPSSWKVLSHSFWS